MMKTINNCKLKFTMLLFVLCFCWNEVSALDWSTRPLVKIDALGNAVAVWEGTDPTTFNSIIQTNYLAFGGSWSGPINLSSTSENGYTPKLAVNATGDVVVIWQSYDSSGNISLLGISKPSAGVYGSIQSLSNSGELVLNNYDVSLSDTGKIIASWDAYIDSSFISVIRSSTSTIASGTWTPATTISP